MLRDQGRQLVTVNWLPEPKRDDHAANIAGQQAEIVQWNTRDWTRQRPFPFTLQTTHWAPYTQGEVSLVLVGSAFTRGQIDQIAVRQGRQSAETGKMAAVACQSGGRRK